MSRDRLNPYDHTPMELGRAAEQAFMEEGLSILAELGNMSQIPPSLALRQREAEVYAWAAIGIRAILDQIPGKIKTALNPKEITE